MAVVAAYCTNPVMVEGLRSIIDAIASFRLSQVSSEMDALISEAQERKPDILLLEVDSAVTLELLRQIAIWAPSTFIVLRVGAVTTEFMSQALQLGVRGILSSKSSVKKHAECLVEVNKGHVWVEKEVSQDLRHTSQVILTPRQRQIMGLVSQGLSNKEIGWSLDVTENTVKAYLSRLFDKMGVSDRLELALIVLRNIAANDQSALKQKVDRVPGHRVVPYDIPRYLTI